VGSGGDPTRIVGAIATKDAADLASQALAEKAARTALAGTITIIGNGSLRPGDTFKLVDPPFADPGTLRVSGVQHFLDSSTGYVTRLQVEAAGNATGLPL